MNILRAYTQSGDTIVEVLISMAVISLVLGGAFVTTRHSQTAVLDSQEHAIALKLAESQVEQMRGNTDVFSAGTFCMVNGNVVSPVDSKCTQDSSGAEVLDPNLEPKYTMTITSKATVAPAPLGGILFTITASWDAVNGGGSGSEIMLYRMYP